MMKTEIITELRGLADGSIKPVCKGYGACKHIRRKFSAELDELVDFEKYPNYSGNKIYPVPYLDHAHEGYVLAQNLWDRRTRYGKERFRFCAWCADELEKNL